MTSPYELLGVPVDASPERIRRADELEVARAHRNGATRHAVGLSGAFDVLSSPARRALYDRHGFTAVRERSLGALTPPTPRRLVEQPLPAPNGTRAPAPTPRWRDRHDAGVRPRHHGRSGVGRVRSAAGESAQPIRHAGSPDSAAAASPLQPTPAGDGYIYSASVVSAPSCRNGAMPVILSH